MPDLLLLFLLSSMETVVRSIPIQPQLTTPEVSDVSHIVNSFQDPQNISLETQLAPTLTRGARSASFGGLGHMGGLAMLPLFEGLLLQQTSGRQLLPAVTGTSSLSSLLPLLLSGSSYGSFGSFGSIESQEGGINGGINLLLNSALLTSAVAPAIPSALVSSPNQMSRLHLMGGANKGENHDWKFSYDDPIPGSNCTSTNRSAVCDNLPVDRILALKNAVIVTKGQSVYRIKPSGEPIDMKPTIFDVKIEPITATAYIKNFYFVFQGDKYTKFDANLKQAPGKFPRLVTSGFPGVITPVDGVFQLNNHTFVFVSDTKFVYFQPEANPNVDPKYSPQYLDNVPGAPNTVDSIFSIRDRKFLYKGGTIYEMAPGEMKVLREIPVVSSSEKTWMKCPDIFPTNCDLNGTERQISAANFNNSTEHPLP